MSFPLPLPPEDNQVGVERNRQDSVTNDTKREREDGNKAVNPPLIRHGGSHDNHADNAEETEEECALEALEDNRDLLEEGAVLDFLVRGTPLHVDAEQMAQEGLRDVERDTSEEDRHERDPGEILEKCGEEALFACAPAENSERDVAESGEDGEDSNVDTETGEVVCRVPTVVPADDEVVGHVQNPGCADSVVRADVSHDGAL